MRKVDQCLRLAMDGIKYLEQTRYSLACSALRLGDQYEQAIARMEKLYETYTLLESLE